MIRPAVLIPRVRVLIFAPRLPLQGGHRVAPDAVLQGKAVERRLLHRRGERQAGRVAEDVADGDGLRGLFEQDVVVVTLDGDPLVPELGEEFGDGVVERHLPLIDEHHERRGGHRLRLRRDPEEGVGRHRRFGGDVEVADGIEAEDLVLVCDQGDGARQLMLIDERLQGGDDGLGTGRRGVLPIGDGQGDGRGDQGESEPVSHQIAPRFEKNRSSDQAITAAPRTT